MNWTAEKIKNLRKKMGWSPDDLARWLKCSHKNVIEWESGLKVPNRDCKLKLIEIEDWCLDSATAISETARLEGLMKDSGLDQIVLRNPFEQEK